MRRPLVQAPCGAGGVTPYFAEPGAVREFGFVSDRNVDRVQVQMGSPLSRVTVGSLEDLGRAVDHSQADSFVPGPPGAPGGALAGADYTDLAATAPLLADPGPARRR